MLSQRAGRSSRSRSEYTGDVLSTRRRALLASPAVAAALLAAAIVSALPADAEACCAPAFRMRPDLGDTFIPANTKIWLMDVQPSYCVAPELRQEDGTTIATVRSQLQRPGTTMITVVLAPTEPLDVGGSYEVVGCEGYVGDAMTFSVTSPVDSEPPAVPVVELAEIDEGDDNSSLGVYEYARFAVYEGGPLIAVDIAGQSALDPDGPSGSLTDLLETGFVMVGDGPCHDNWDPEEDATDVRFASFDLAGNFSGWSEPQDVEFGCSVADLSPSAGDSWWWAVLAGLAWRVAYRRRFRA